MKSYKERAERIMERIDQLAAISEMENCLTRTYGSPAFYASRELIYKWMKEAGLNPYIDTIGNVRCGLIANPDSKSFVIGSHFDSVVNAGKYDGPLGILIGIDLAENIQSNPVTLPFNLEVAAFCDEEGCRFHSTYLGSKAMTGKFEPALLEITDDRGVSLSEYISKTGSDPGKLKNDAISKNKWLGYYEVHIEQGPVLYKSKIPVAPVTGIAGQFRVQWELKGESGHAGTVPMKLRRDALACAAEIILEIEKFAGKNEKNLVATIGKLEIENAAGNVIPGYIKSTLDLRSGHIGSLRSAYDHIFALAEDTCRKRKIDLTWKIIQYTDPVTCDQTFNQLLSQSIMDAGIKVIPLTSGAGHDAVPISEVAPVSMLFVKCFEGISHDPRENVDASDVAVALEVSDKFIRKLADHY